MTTCLNCEKEFKGKFCPKCGQKSKTGRITLSAVAQELRQHLIHFDQGFVYTIKQLAIRPGHTVREYLEGKRVQHIKPLKFLFWTTAITFLVSHYLGMDEMILESMEKQSSNLQHGQAIQQKLTVLLINHPAITIFSQIPFIALFSWLLFRRRGYNYAEHFVFSAFLLGELNLIGVLTTPFIRYWGNMENAALLLTVPSLLIWFGYSAWAYGQFYQTQRLWVRVKGGLAILLGYISMSILIGMITALAVALFLPQIEAWIQ